MPSPGKEPYRLRVLGDETVQNPDPGQEHKAAAPISWRWIAAGLMLFAIIGYIALL